MGFNIENHKVIALEEIKNLNTKELEILGVILVVNNQNNQQVELSKGDQKPPQDDSLLSGIQVYRILKKKEPVSQIALRCFLSRLRNQGLAAIPIGGAYLYKPKDLDVFLNKLKEN